VQSKHVERDENDGRYERAYEREDPNPVEQRLSALHWRLVSLVQQLLGEHERRRRSADKDHPEKDPGARPPESPGRQEQHYAEEEGVENDPGDLFEAVHWDHVHYVTPPRWGPPG